MNKITRLMRPRVKICCIGSKEEARLAISYGAVALGLVGPMPSGPGVIPDAMIREIARWAPPGIATFLLTSETQVKEVIRHYHRVNTSTIQLVDALPPGSHAKIREALPNVKLAQVIHVTGESSLEEALQVAPAVDVLLLDSGNPGLAVKELGGTGRVHNWQISRKIREQAEKPVFLAGGLNPDNLAQAIDAVEPFGIDVCSGLRTEGKLDERKLEKFFRVLERY